VALVDDPLAAVVGDAPAALVPVLALLLALELLLEWDDELQAAATRPTSPITAKTRERISHSLSMALGPPRTSRLSSDTVHRVPVDTPCANDGVGRGGGKP